LMTARPGVEVAYAGRDALVYEIPGALPRLFVPRTLTIEPETEEAVAAARLIEDFAEFAVVDRAPASAAQGDVAAGHLANGPAVVTSLDVERGRIQATVEATAPAVVATSQPAIPGWRLALDPRPAGPERLLRVNGAFLGIEVPAGRHEIALRYQPASWRQGLALGALGLAAAALLLAAGWRGPGRGRPRGRGSEGVIR